MALNDFPIRIIDLDEITDGMDHEELIDHVLDDEAFYLLLSAVDSRNCEDFLKICLSWEEKFIDIWEERIERFTRDFKEAMSARLNVGHN